MNSATAAMRVVEVVLWAAFALLFWVRGFQRRFRITGVYFVLRTISGSILLIVLNLELTPFGEEHRLGIAYFFANLAMHIANAVWMFFICLEVFRSALSAFPGTSKLAIVIFRWAAAASVIVCSMSIFHVHQGFHILADSSYSLMRFASIIELCLWAFLFLGINALRLPASDLAFGVTLGSGIMSASDLVLAFWSSQVLSTTSLVQFVGGSLMLAALGVWIAYCVLSEPASRPVLLPASSTVCRWSEIARALGHTGTTVAVQRPANSIFFSDVERVVEKVMARNMGGPLDPFFPFHDRPEDSARAKTVSTVHSASPDS